MRPVKTMVYVLAFTAATPVLAGQLVTMHTEQQAITYCAGGGVVWMDLMSGKYVYKGSPYYGKGKDAAYVCEVQAIQAGGSPTPQKQNPQPAGRQ